MPITRRTQWLALMLAIASACVVTRDSIAEDWGAYSIVPASAPNFVLEVVDSGTTEGTIISIGKPAGTPNQKWIIVPKGENFFTVRPSYSSTLVMAAAKGGTSLGTRIVLETPNDKPWQEWTLSKNEDESYCLIPRHTPDRGLDHLGGKATAGAQIDLWDNQPGDQHLRWFIRPLAGTTAALAAGITESPPSTYVPPEIKSEDIRKGEIKNFTFTTSAIFPGTVRQVTVFIPAQYDGSKPACVYVKTDGFNPHEQTLLETLIATGEIPVTVGVFVRPGDLPATVKNTMGRRNRCFEYDGVGDNNVRFFIDELLPYIAKEYNLKLSASGNDRCIAGGSSGGIAAFNAAWERPDAFSRVYANSGSFVAFRGGHEFPTLVRKFEAKPIRAFLTTGMRDMENCAGDWFLLDLEMDKALKFSGYDYSFRIINGGHVVGYYDYYRESMAFIWKDWPKPVQAGPSAPRVRDIILPDEPWQLLAQDRHDAKGPACNATGDVFFIEADDNQIRRIDGEGKIQEFLTDAERANCLTVGSDGTVYTASNTSGKILSYDVTGKRNLVTDGIRGQQLLAMPGGGLYVSSNQNSGEVWFVKGGIKTSMDSGLKFATGLAFRPDQWLLSVADGHSKWVYSYQANADGTLTNKERFFPLHVVDGDDDAGAESICYSSETPMFVATRSGVQVCADDGPTQVVLPLPDRAPVIGICFGGREMDILYAFTGEKIWKRKVKVHGIGAFSPWTAARGSPL